MTTPNLINKLLKKEYAKNAANTKENPGSFETGTQAPVDGYTVIYYTTICPLANFTKTYGYNAYMPYICNLDYVMFAAFNVSLAAKKYSQGNAYCDFNLKSYASIASAWLFHGMDENDRLCGVMQ